MAACHNVHHNWCHAEHHIRKLHGGLPQCASQLVPRGMPRQETGWWPATRNTIARDCMATGHATHLCMWCIAWHGVASRHAVSNRGTRRGRPHATTCTAQRSLTHLVCQTDFVFPETIEPNSKPKIVVPINYIFLNQKIDFSIFLSWRLRQDRRETDGTISKARDR